jgi:hypothetical protein
MNTIDSGAKHVMNIQTVSVVWIVGFSYVTHALSPFNIEKELMIHENVSKLIII